MMNKGLQDLVWSLLPKEFKEEVKKIYNSSIWVTDYDQGYKHAMDKFFGHHNLTSDADGEEMLTVPRKKVQEIYSDYCAERDKEEPGSNRSSLGGRIAMLQELFGSKCLPDEKEEDNDFNVSEPKCIYYKDGKCAHPSVCHLENGKLVKGADCDVSSCEDVEYTKNENKAESSSQNPSENCDNADLISTDCDKPKFTKGGMVHCKSFGYEGDYKVLGYAGGPRNCYDCIDKYGAYYRFYESDLEPYTEPTNEASPNVNRSDINIDELVAKGCVPDPAKQFDLILKDSFRNERRLNVAAMIVQGVLSNPNIIRSCSDFEGSDEYIVKTALMYTDTLMDECEKGGCHD